jgi:hypothetical protein
VRQLLVFLWMGAALAGILGGGCYALVGISGEAGGHQSGAVGAAFIFAGLGAWTVAYLLDRERVP